MKKPNILMVCGCGLGSSFVCEMTVESVLKNLGIEANLNHCDISSVASMKADIIVTGLNFKNQFERLEIDETKTQVIYIKNLVSKEEVQEKLLPLLQKLDIL